MSGRIWSGSEITADRELSCDVCIIGSGAGGAVLAAGLVEKGLNVVMLEEGGYYNRSDFNLNEGDAFGKLYQEGGTRSTADLAITILQGRSVGGSTTINWTTCYRTPERILENWRSVHGVDTLDATELAPHFEAVEKRLNIGKWQAELINKHNGTLKRGCEKLGYDAHVLRRNVKGCANSGFCGVGCPVDGKQAMHVTYLPDAVRGGLTLLADCRAERIEVEGGRARRVHAVIMNRDMRQPTATKVTVSAKVVVNSGGAINAPALLLRSGLNGNGRVGKRTFIHPVVAMMGVYDEPIHPWMGAPQSVASHEFVDRGANKMGYFLEVPPLHPMLAATAMPVFGDDERAFMEKLPNIAGFLAIHVDGLLPNDEGGTVSLRSDGRLRVDYPLGPAHIEAFRHANERMAAIHLAAGSTDVFSLHVNPVRVRKEADLAGFAQAEFGAHKHSIFTAHQMGGCAMGPDPATSVVNTKLQHHEAANLFVVDGSVLPTALGVNPSETIYGIARWATEHVAAAV